MEVTLFLEIPLFQINLLEDQVGGCLVAWLLKKWKENILDIYV